ncbi:MAG: TonB-dependent receptor, partial [Cytophagales bacterium]|nr:TonB-dependent receptor [Cytophagales bacterium]
GKGFSMNNHGVLNVNLDYTSSYPDVRKKYKGYKRLTTNLGYSNTFFQKNKPLLFNLRLALFTTVDDEKSDPQLKNNEVITANKDGLRAAINGKWLLNSKWITNLSYNFSANYAHQHDYLKKLKTITAGTMPLATSLKHGEHTAQFLPAEYYSELTVDGKPFDIFARVMGNLSLTKSQVNNNIVYGAEWRANGNKGDGRIFDLNYPPEINSISTIRERSYKERPTLHSLALFVEDNVGNDLLRIQAGLRYNNFQPVNIFDSEKKTIEPRINIKYSFIRYEEKKLFSELSVFGGYGIQSKSPTLAHLYPDNAYFDLNSFNYFSNNADERLLLVSTRIIDPTDKLEPIEVSKIEIGFDGKVKGMKFIFTGYYEKSDNGLTFTTHHNFIEFGKWNTDDTNIIYREEAPPIIDLNALTEVDTFTAKYAKPQNTHIIIKKGLEYRFDFDKIKFLNTSFNNSRAYLYTKNYNGSETYMLLYGDGANQPPYVGIYAACEGRERQRFNTNFVAITHLPKLRLAFSTTLQVLWKSRYRYFLGGRQLWEYSTDNTNYLIEAPIALIDKEGVRREISKDEIFSQEYDYYISKYREEYYQVENQPIHYQLNPKVTSEIGEKAKFAFFANNFTMLNPTYKSKRTNSVFTLNSPVYY